MSATTFVNHLSFSSRTSFVGFEERLNRLRRDMDQIREEKTRLNVALDFSKDERNLLNKQLKEAQDKTSKN